MDVTEVGETAIDHVVDAYFQFQVHWRAVVIQRQHYVYKMSRCCYKSYLRAGASPVSPYFLPCQSVTVLMEVAFNIRKVQSFFSWVKKTPIFGLWAKG